MSDADTSHVKRDGETAALCGARDWIQVIKDEPPCAVGPCLFAAGHRGRCRDEFGNWWQGPGLPVVAAAVQLPVAAPVQVADDLRVPVEGERVEVGGVKITRHSLFGPPDLRDRLFEIGTLLDLPGADCREVGKVSAAARERIPAWRDCAGAVGGLASLLGLDPPLPSPDEVCAAALDRINQRTVGDAALKANLDAAVDAGATNAADLRTARVELGELRSHHAIVEDELADQRRVYGEACAEIAALRDRLAFTEEAAQQGRCLHLRIAWRLTHYRCQECGAPMELRPT